MPTEITRAIRKIKVTRKITTTKDGNETELTTFDIVLHDKLRALELLHKQQGWYQNTHQSETNFPRGIIVLPEDKTIEQVLKEVPVVLEQ